jgi:hypothetical protein
MKLFEVIKKIIYAVAAVATMLIAANRELNFLGDQAATFLWLAACLFLGLSAWIYFSDPPKPSAQASDLALARSRINFRAFGVGVFLTLAALISTFFLTGILGTKIDVKRDTVIFVLALLFSAGVGLISLSLSRSKYVKDLFRSRRA